jgi:hypothetical protein
MVREWENIQFAPDRNEMVVHVTGVRDSWYWSMEQPSS